MTVFYALLKFAAYAGWCWIGLRALRPGTPPRLASALGLGLLRLSMGLAFGILIWVLAYVVAAGGMRSQPLIYLAVYVPVRWIEWGIIEALIESEFRMSRFLLGYGPLSTGWRSRGIVLSCLADIPVVASIGGLPIGRFMC